jgi:hypothetical protein
MSVLEYETKDKPAALLKYDAGAGSGTLLFSRYFVEDADHDYTKPGFIQDGVTVPLLVGHVWAEIPRGKAKVRSAPDGAYADFVLADTPRGREMAEWLRFDMADGQPNSEWSYGFSILEGGSSRETINGTSVRVLHALPSGDAGARLHEISYVLRGSGVSTALVSMKGEQRYRWDRRHAELTAQLEARQRAEQAEIQQLYTQFKAREREIYR